MCLQRPFVWDAANTTRVTDTSSPTMPKKVGGFLQGVEAQYASNLALRTAVIENATTFGVGTDTTPLP
jgi:hypothetical protein